MITSSPPRTAARPTKPALLLVLAVIAAGAIGARSLASADGAHHAAEAPPSRRSVASAAIPSAAVTSAAVPTAAVRSAKRTAAFDDGSAGVANLDPALLSALREAAEDAHDVGVTIHVNSGWRSAAYQEQLLQQAIARYGSEREAERWVATPETSAHVSGEAVDLGPSAATSWLSRHGAAYGLCQIYRNEPWHYELRPSAVDHGCPAMYADPTQDPRMHR